MYNTNTLVPLKSIPELYWKLPGTSQSVITLLEHTVYASNPGLVDIFQLLGRQHAAFYTTYSEH